jgi:hypothetical protein
VADVKRFKPLGGTSRQYLDLSTGKTVSRRQRDNVLARAAGFKNREEVERARLRVRREYPDWYKRVRKHTGKAPTWTDYRKAEQVRTIRARLAGEYGEPDKPWGNDFRSPELTAADGPLAEFLDAAGIRSKNGKPVGGS